VVRWQADCLEGQGDCDVSGPLKGVSGAFSGALPQPPAPPYKFY